MNKIDQSLSFQEQALKLRGYRQQVLASNIANADTPHYKARDLDFASVLQATLAGRQQGGLDLRLTNPRHLPGRSSEPAFPLLYRQPVQASADGNTVEMDVEREQFAENAFHYEAGMTFLGGRLKTLLAAIQGQ